MRKTDNNIRQKKADNKQKPLIITQITAGQMAKELGFTTKKVNGEELIEFKF